MNGCGELSLKLQKFLKQQRRLRRSLHVVWLDTANAYGSVREDLKNSRNRFGVSSDFKTDILNYSEGLKFKVSHDGFVTAAIDFNVGLFQGDTTSCALFLIAFDCILEFLEENRDVGIVLSTNSTEDKIVALAFADDLTFISHKKASSIRLVTEVKKKCRE